MFRKKDGRLGREGDRPFQGELQIQGNNPVLEQFEDTVSSSIRLLSSRSASSIFSCSALRSVLYPVNLAHGRQFFMPIHRTKNLLQKSETDASAIPKHDVFYSPKSCELQILRIHTPYLFNLMSG